MKIWKWNVFGTQEKETVATADPNLTLDPKREVADLTERKKTTLISAMEAPNDAPAIEFFIDEAAIQVAAIERAYHVAAEQKLTTQASDVEQKIGHLRDVHSNVDTQRDSARQTLINSIRALFQSNARQYAGCEAEIRRCGAREKELVEGLTGSKTATIGEIALISGLLVSFAITAITVLVEMMYNQSVLAFATEDWMSTAYSLTVSVFGGLFATAAAFYESAMNRWHDATENAKTTGVKVFRPSRTTTKLHKMFHWLLYGTIAAAVIPRLIVVIVYEEKTLVDMAGSLGLVLLLAGLYVVELAICNAYLPERMIELLAVRRSITHNARLQARLIPNPTQRNTKKAIAPLKKAFDQTVEDAVKAVKTARFEAERSIATLRSLIADFNKSDRFFMDLYIAFVTLVIRTAKRLGWNIDGFNPINPRDPALLARFNSKRGTPFTIPRVPAIPALIVSPNQVDLASIINEGWDTERNAAMADVPRITKQDETDDVAILMHSDEEA